MRGGWRRLWGRFEVLHRRGRVMLVSAALMLLAGLAVVVLTPPAYTARALIYFEPLDATNGDEETQLQAEIGRVTSQAVLRATAQRLGLFDAAQGIVGAQERLTELRAAVSTGRFGDTFLIAIEARANNPEEAARIANSLAHSFVAAEHAGTPTAQLIDASLAVPEAAAPLSLSGSRMAAEAEVPGAPLFPKSPLAVLVLAGAACFAAFGGAGMAEWLSDSFVDEEETARALGVRQVAPIPLHKPRRLADGETQLTPADEVIEAPLDTYAEAVRRLRAGIDRGLQRWRGSPDAGAVIMVTSPMAGDGKTTLALALARTYARAGRSVLLIDCDLGAPNLHNLVGREPSRGLVDYLHGLAGPTAMGEIISMDEASGARLAMGAPGGRRPEQPLPANPAFARLAAAARRHFDVVILDTPAIAEALPMAAFADSAVLVLRWGRTGRKPAAAAARALADFLPAGAETVAVLNQRGGWRQ